MPMKVLLWFSASLIAGLASCGGSSMPACQPQGQACDTTHLCCGNDLCTNGQCVAPTAMCASAGQSCGASGGLSVCCAGLNCVASKCTAAPACKTLGVACNAANPCCSGLSCSVGTCTQMCGSLGAACSTMNDCCQGATCPRFGTKCALGSIGDPCQQNADCHTNLTCSGMWCTKTCAADSDCGATNECIAVSTGGFECFPGCAGSPPGTLNQSACTYLPGTTCQNGTDPQNLMLPICSG